MTKEQFRKKLINKGWQEDPIYGNRLFRDGMRCKLLKKSYLMEELAQDGVWDLFETKLYKKVK